MLAIGTKPSGLRCKYRWSLNDGDGLNDLLLVGLRSWTVEVADDGGHTSLIAHGGSKVDWLLCVILWEAVGRKDRLANLAFNSAILTSIEVVQAQVRLYKQKISQYLPLDLSSVSGSSLSWQVCQRSVTRSLKLSVRHGDGRVCRSRLHEKMKSESVKKISSLCANFKRGS
jgi:hypothetical protein